MALLAFLVETLVISLSGVMAPGPVTAVTVGKGSRSPLAGAWVAVGHGVVEFPLMAAIFFGLGYVVEMPAVQVAIAAVGGVILALMGVGMLRGAGRVELAAARTPDSPVLAGVLLSLGNPYFLVWWATVGAALILRAAGFGAWGFVAFALVHWSCDFVWSTFLSVLSFKGGQFFGRTFQKLLFLVCGVFLLVLSARFLWDAVRAI